MDHKAAKAIFEDIRNRPYAWSTVPGESADNCYFKGVDLLKGLGVLGYSVRGRIGDTYLDDKVSAEIKGLYPSTFPLTHFWVEVHLEDQWRALDPSYDPPLARAGFLVNEWDSNRTCFDITRIYTQEESIAYQNVWQDSEYVHKYFEAIAPCAAALNKWYQTLRG